MTLDAGATTFVFDFPGPDLTAYFTVGELVDVSVSGDWSVVANAKATASAGRVHRFTPSPLSETPGGGPTISFGPQCSFTKVGFCSKMPQDVTPLHVVATRGAEAVITLPMRAVASLAS